MVRATVRVAVSLAIVFALFSAVLPAPVHAAASIVQQQYGVCWDCTVTGAYFSDVATGNMIVVVVAGYVPCPTGQTTCAALDQLEHTQNGVDSYFSVSDNRGSTFTRAVNDLGLTSCTGTSPYLTCTLVQVAIIYVATLSSSGREDVTVRTPSISQELDMYMYEVSGVNTLGPTTGTNGAGYDVSTTHFGATSFPPGAFLLGAIGTECPANGNGYSVGILPGQGYTLSPALYDPSPPPTGKCTSLHAEYSTSGVSSPTTFPATIIGTTNPRWVEVAIVLNPGFLFTPTQIFSSTSTSSPTSSTSATSQTVLTDWAVVQVWVEPSLPTEGNAVRLGMTMTALSTTGAYPQSVSVNCIIDGLSCGSGRVTYPGPTATTFTVTADTPWNALPGTHTLSWQVDPTNDSNPANNVQSRSFMVQSSSTSQSASTTTMELSSSQSSTEQVTVVQTQTVTQQSTSVTPQAASQPGILDVLQQNSLPLIGALGLVVIVLVIALMRHGRHRSPTPSH